MQAKAAARLGPLGHLHTGLAAVDGRHLEVSAKGGRNHGDRHPAMQIGAVALEERMRGERQEDVEVARRSAADAGLAFARQANAGPVFDTGGDVNREGALAREPPGARA